MAWSHLYVNSLKKRETKLTKKKEQKISEGSGNKEIKGYKPWVTRLIRAGNLMDNSHYS